MLIQYLITMALLTVYGFQVCPFVDSLSLMQWFVCIAINTAVTLLIRRPVMNRFVLSKPAGTRETAFFVADFSLFIVLGTGITLYNFFLYDFPVGSGLKILLGTASLGFFLAIDNALTVQYSTMKKFRETHQDIHVAEKFPSLTQKFTLCMTVTLLASGSIFLLLLIKDLQVILETNDTLQKNVVIAIVVEFLFTISIFIICSLKIIRSYTRNLQFMFTNQNEVLHAVTKGRFDTKVTVASNDEFGVMAQYTNTMINELDKQTKEIKKTQEATILSLVSLAETKDTDTADHIVRTQWYVKYLAEDILKRGHYIDLLNEEVIDRLFHSAPLHDIGKVGIPDAILCKAGPLTEEEWDIMHQHPLIGYEGLKKAEQTLGENFFLHMAAEISLSHHEKWDGSGYPNKVKGNDIPLSGRLMAVADVYDALTTSRPYKKAFSHEKAKGILLEGRGSHFDPLIIDSFLNLEEVFTATRQRYQNDALCSPVA